MHKVRVATPADAEAIAAIYAPYVLETTISFEDLPPTSEEMAGRIETTLAGHPYLVLEDDGGVIGYAYSGPHAARAAYHWSVNVSVYVERRVHRSGVGRALYAELLDLLRRQGFHSAFAGIALPNDRSVGLHEAMGFVPIGVYREVGFKFGAWHDVGWWRLGLNEGLPTAKPVAFPALDR